MAWFLAPLALLGCGEAGEDRPKPPVLVPVQGTVRLDGQPLAGAVIMFLPVEMKGNDTVSTGETDSKGAYHLTYLTSDGTTAGDYRVTVSYLMGSNGKPQLIAQRFSPSFLPSMVDAKELLPPEYSDQAKTTLKSTVPPGGMTIDFDLKGPLLDPPKLPVNPKEPPSTGEATDT